MKNRKKRKIFKKKGIITISIEYEMIIETTRIKEGLNK